MPGTLCSNGGLVEVIAYSCDQYVLPLPEGHRFPMERYRLLRERVERLPGVELRVPPLATRDQLLLAHTEEYVDKIFSGRLERMEERRLGLPWSEQLVERSRRSVGATLAAAREALLTGTAVNLAGGTHHAFADRGEGFCVFNDCVVAALALREVGPIAFVDCDVHQGDGSASLCQGHPRLFTLSLHGQNNYPFHKQQSSLDLGLPDGCGDEEYLSALDLGLQAVQQHRPRLVFYVAGADAYEKDRLGKLKLTMEGLAERDRRVFAAFPEAAVVVTMAGGYAVPIEDTADIQAETVGQASLRT